MNNDLINELNNKIDVQDKIINTQALEIARLNKDLKDACLVIEKLKKEKEKAIEYIKGHTDKLKTIRVPKIDFDYSELLEILGEKENEI